MNQCERTREMLIMHYQTYPKLQVQDIFKFLYQSAFGCEHFVSSVDIATGFIEEEYNSLCTETATVIEKLDGDYSRVPVSYMSNGLSAHTFGKLFVASAQPNPNGMTHLLQKLNVAKQAVRDGLLPFSEKEFDEAAKDWEIQGYPSVHHSNLFKKCYHPAYRVMSNKYIPFLPLFAELDKRLAEGKVIFALEGGSAAGKTTLSKLFESIYDCTVFHMDDFFLQPHQRTPERFAKTGGNIDWERFLSEVLLPLSEGENITYKKFDCSSKSLSEEIHTTPKKLVVVEGVYSMHPELEKFYDFSVFLDISHEQQRERILHRNSPESAQRFFNEWIPLENNYFEKTLIKQRCDMTIQVL